MNLSKSTQRTVEAFFSLLDLYKEGGENALIPIRIQSRKDGTDRVAIASVDLEGTPFPLAVIIDYDRDEFFDNFDLFPEDKDEGPFPIYQEPAKRGLFQWLRHLFCRRA